MTVPMTATVALAGDTMLGRAVASALAELPPAALVAPAVVEAMRAADLVVLNLECCISTRGQRWPAPGKPFFFRAPPAAVEPLGLLNVGCVTLANNRALDYGPQALLDTLDQLATVGIATVGAGSNLDQARRPVVLDAGSLRLGVVGDADHPADFAAGPNRPGVAVADLSHGVPAWLQQTIQATHTDPAVDAVLATPTGGRTRPPPRCRMSAARPGSSVRPARPWWPATPPMSPTGSGWPAVRWSCTTWATSSTTTPSTRSCVTTLACCGWPPSTGTACSGWRRSRSSSTTATPASRRGRRGLAAPAAPGRLRRPRHPRHGRGRGWRRWRRWRRCSPPWRPVGGQLALSPS